MILESLQSGVLMNVKIYSSFAFEVRMFETQMPVTALLAETGLESILTIYTFLRMIRRFIVSLHAHHGQ